MSWKEIFKDSNDWNEKSILGSLSFAVMVLVMALDVITGAFGKDLVINEAVYNSFVIVTLGSFSIAGIEKFATINEKRQLMNFTDVKVYTFNSLTMMVTFTDMEMALKILLLVASIGYTIQKWYLMNKDAE